MPELCLHSPVVQVLAAKYARAAASYEHPLAPECCASARWVWARVAASCRARCAFNRQEIEQVVICSGGAHAGAARMLPPSCLAMLTAFASCPCSSPSPVACSHPLISRAVPYFPACTAGQGGAGCSRGAASGCPCSAACPAPGPAPGAAAGAAVAGHVQQVCGVDSEGEGVGAGWVAAMASWLGGCSVCCSLR